MSVSPEHRTPGLGVRPNRRPRFPHPTIILGYAVALMMGTVGVLILLGVLIREGVPDRFRIMFGIVITLMGAYRFVLTRSRALQRQREEREERDEE